MEEVNDVSLVAAVLEDSNVVPRTSLEMTVDNVDSVLIPGPEQNALMESLIRDIAASLGIDPSLVQISGIRAAESADDTGRRRTQTTPGSIAFDVVVNGPTAADAVVELVQQIADSSSPLMQSPTARAIDATVAPVFEFQCPAGTVKPCETHKPCICSILSTHLHCFSTESMFCVVLFYY
jgi:hypothetical protein